MNNTQLKRHSLQEDQGECLHAAPRKPQNTIHSYWSNHAIQFNSSLFEMKCIEDKVVLVN